MRSREPLQPSAAHFDLTAQPMQVNIPEPVIDKDDGWMVIKDDMNK